MIFFTYIVFLTLDHLLKPLISGRRMSLIQKLKQNRFKVGSAIFAGDYVASYLISFHTISLPKQIPVIFSKTLRSTSAFLGRYIHFHNTEITAQIQAETCRFFFIIRKKAFSHFLRPAEVWVFLFLCC